MAYNQKFYKTESATAHSLTSCAAGTRGVGAYTASAESIISQRDTDRKALVWAQAAAQSLVTCRYDPFSSVSGLNVLPVTGFESSGEEGGPFSPATIQYTILNFGNEDCNWQCNASESWVTVSATSGFLYAGESVVIQIGLDANALLVGTHTATLTFYNASKSIVATTRQVVLEVTSAPAGCLLTLPTLLMDGTETPYANLPTAQAALISGVASCLAQQSPPASGEAVDSFTAAFGAGILSVGRTHSVTVNPSVGNAAVLFSGDFKAAGGIQIDYSLVASVAPNIMGLAVQVYAASDLVTPVVTDSDDQPATASISGTFNLAIPSDGVYFVFISYGIYVPSGSPVTSLAFTEDVSSADTFTPCTIRAAWDNGGTTEYESCTP